jgi:hypothetical protein
VTKTIPWRNGPQEFSNVYHFKTALSEPFDDNELINKIVLQEKTFHSSNVTFKVARTWGPTDGTQQQSVTRTIKDLTGTGELTPGTNWYRELAFLVVWPLGRYGSKNRPQFLRKWYHTDNAMAVAASVLTGATAIPLPANNALATAIPKITNNNAGFLLGDFKLSTAEGREPVGPGSMYKWLEHRQLGR